MPNLMIGASRVSENFFHIDCLQHAAALLIHRPGMLSVGKSKGMILLKDQFPDGDLSKLEDPRKQLQAALAAVDSDMPDDF